MLHFESFFIGKYAVKLTKKVVSISKLPKNQMKKYRISDFATRKQLPTYHLFPRKNVLFSISII